MWLWITTSLFYFLARTDGESMWRGFVICMTTNGGSPSVSYIPARVCAFVR